MAEFPTIQLRVAEAAASIDAAREVLLRDLRDRASAVRGDRPVSIEERIVSRRGQAFAVSLAIRASEALNASTGGQGLDLANPVQRAWRDANAVGRHISMNWDAVGTMYGQLALGPDRRKANTETSDKGETTMQGKIALEEHFAIPETLMDSAGFVPESYWPELKDRLLDIQDKRLAADGRAGRRDDDPLAQRAGRAGDPRRQEGNEIAVRANDYPRRTGRETSRPLSGLCGAADARSGSRDRGTRARRQDARLQGRAGQRLLASRRRQDCRSITI